MRRGSAHRYDPELDFSGENAGISNPYVQSGIIVFAPDELPLGEIFE